MNVSSVPRSLPRPAVHQAGGLVPDHLARLQQHGVRGPGVVLDTVTDLYTYVGFVTGVAALTDVQRPLLGDGLLDVEDGGDDVGVEPVHVRRQPGAVGVAPARSIVMSQRVG